MTQTHWGDRSALTMAAAEHDDHDLEWLFRVQFDAQRSPAMKAWVKRLNGTAVVLSVSDDKLGGCV